MLSETECRAAMTAAGGDPSEWTWVEAVSGGDPVVRATRQDGDRARCIGWREMAPDSVHVALETDRGGLTYASAHGGGTDAATALDAALAEARGLLP